MVAVVTYMHKTYVNTPEWRATKGLCYCHKCLCGAVVSLQGKRQRRDTSVHRFIIMSSSGSRYNGVQSYNRQVSRQLTDAVTTDCESLIVIPLETTSVWNLNLDRIFSLFFFSCGCNALQIVKTYTNIKSGFAEYQTWAGSMSSSLCEKGEQHFQIMSTRRPCGYFAFFSKVPLIYTQKERLISQSQHVSER